MFLSMLQPVSMFLSMLQHVSMFLSLFSPAERASKHMEELLSMAGNMKVPIENKPGDNAILKVIEAYCAGGGRGGAIRKSTPTVTMATMCCLSHVCVCVQLVQLKLVIW